MPKPLVYHDGEPFPGRVGATFAESAPAWPVPRRAPEGAPNVVLVVLDDVGFAQLGCFGSDIETPRFDRLAADGLRYRSFHTTAMCSPTRACLLTGRNHHTCAMGGITDLAMGFPGYNGRIPKSCGFVSEVLRAGGLGDVRGRQVAPGAVRRDSTPRRRATAGRSARASSASTASSAARRTSSRPTWCVDNSPIRVRRRPTATTSPKTWSTARSGMVTDVRAADPDKPFFLYLALGACHAPHQAPREWIERYRGRFDDGLGRVARARPSRGRSRWASSRPGTTLSRAAVVGAGVGVAAGRRARAYARMMEVFAGFLSHTDHHLGRLLDFLAATRRARRTLVVLRQRQRRQRRGRAARHVQRELHLQRPAARRRGDACACSTSWAARRPTATTRGAGRSPATRRSGAGSARRTRAASATR